MLQGFLARPTIALKVLSLALTAQALLATSVARADLPIRLGEARVDGSGCPSGTTTAIVSPDGAAVSIFFDRFTVAERAGLAPWQRLRKFCHFNIPVEVAPGYNLQATQIIYRGFTNVTGLSFAMLYTTGPLANADTYLWDGTFARTLIKNQVGNFTVAQTIPGSPVSGRCVPMRAIDFNTFIQISGGYGRNPGIFKTDTEITIDTADLGGQSEDIRINFQVTPCR